MSRKSSEILAVLDSKCLETYKFVISKIKSYQSLEQ